jgi:ribose 1,5-bisphosphate isomerase
MQVAARKIVTDIRSLKIQGARNVAKMALRALAIEANASHASTPAAFYRQLEASASLIANSRPTEPMMRNMIREVCNFALFQMKQGKTVAAMKHVIVAREEELIKQMQTDIENLAKYGAALIPDGALVLTHCHSNTSTSVLKAAHKSGKDFEVVCFETRPRFQGRVTAAELVKTGIKTNLSVDGGMELFLKKADIVIVGADSITSRGDLINKIGTSALAHLAHLNDVSFYSAAELFKYNPATREGVREKIEERDPKEVWDKPPKGLRIRNPAFEVTAARYINGYITEEGVIPPQSLFSVAGKKINGDLRV